MRKRAITKWAGHIAWGAMMLAVTIVALGVQLDFATRTRPALASAVPEIFRSHAYMPLAASMIEAEQQTIARVYATALLQRRPVPAESASLFALAAQAQGEDRLASEALTISALRGWREPVAQTAIIYASLEARDWEVLAQRFDALQRTGKAELIPIDVFTSLLNSSEGRDALAIRLAQERNWLSRFLRLGGDEAISPEQFGDTVFRVNRLGSTADCSELANAARRLLSQAENSAAEKVWSGQCAAALEAMRPGFRPAAAGQAPGPYDWSYPREAGLNRSFRLADENWVIDYDHRDNLRATLAERYLTLPVGTHKLHLPQTATGSQIFVSVRCLGEQARSLLRDVPFHGPISLLIPPDCDVQQLTLRVARGRVLGIQLYLD